MANVKFVYSIVLAAAGLTLSACAIGPSGNTGGMNRAAFGAYKSAESGVALNNALRALTPCNPGEVQANVEAEVDINSGTRFDYDSGRTSRARGVSRNRSAAGNNGVYRDPARERVYSEVDGSYSYTCETPE